MLGLLLQPLFPRSVTLGRFFRPRLLLTLLRKHHLAGAEMVGQRNMAGADQITAAAFNAVRQIQLGAEFHIALADAMVEHLRQQHGRAHTHTLAAVDAGHALLWIAQLLGGQRQQAVAAFVDAQRGIHDLLTHHWTADHQSCIGMLEAATVRDQMLYRRAQQCQPVVWFMYRAGDSDDALDQRLAVDQGMFHGPGGADIDTGQAQTLRIAVCRHFESGQHLDQLALAAFRIHRRHLDDLDVLVIELFTCMFQRAGKRTELVFDGNDDVVDVQGTGNDARAQQHRSGVFAHQHLITTDVGFAFSAVDDQRMRGFAPLRGQLAGSRKHGTAQTDNTGVGNATHDLGAAEIPPVADAALAVRMPFVATVRQQGDGCGRLRRFAQHGLAANAVYATGCGRMQRRRQPLTGTGQQFAFEHLLARRYDGLCGAAGVLQGGELQIFRQRRPL